jgi:hypothetical protein
MASFKNGEGFLLLSTGDPRKQWLFNLIDSIQQHYPEAPVHVLTDAPIDTSHTLIDPLVGEASRYYKTRLFHYSPFETTIFLDDDTLVKASFGNLDDLIGGGNFAMARDPFATLGLWKKNIATHCRGLNAAWDAFEGYVHPRLERLPYYNSGVMIWRKNATAQELFDYWHDLWLNQGKGPDQTWLAIAHLELGIEITPLPLEMNFYPVTEHCVGHDRYPRLEDAKIVHFLSEFGKRRMAELVTRTAPAHSAYLRYKASIENQTSA